MLNTLTKSLTKIFGTKSDKDLKTLWPIVKEINAEWEKIRNITDDQLRAITPTLQEEINQHLSEIDEEIHNNKKYIDDHPELGIEEKEVVFDEIDRLEEERNKKLEEVLMTVLPRAFAVIKETADRFKNGGLKVKASDFDFEVANNRDCVSITGETAVWKNSWTAAGSEIEWNMVHYDVQLIGGIVLHQGKIAEMATGEGKTLVATLPAYLNALAKRGVHIVTVNNYLARRDAEWMAPLFEFHGLTVDCIDNYQPHSEGRIAAYRKDITYGTNNEFGFDYLRDNMVREPSELVQRKHHFAMVDEVDSVLVDDARTPLIISGPVGKSDEQEYEPLKPRVAKLLEQQTRLVQGFLNEAKKQFKQGNTEEAGLPLLRAFKGYPTYKPLIKFLSEIGVKQQLQKTEGFYLQDNSKKMPEAVEPLYFTIDEKNNSVELTEKGIEALTKSGEDSSFFVLPDISIELNAVDQKSDIADEEKVKLKDEIMRNYEIKSKRIHSINQLLKAYTLFEKDVDYVVMDGKVKIVDEQTGRIMEGRRYSDGLHQALEAKENVTVEEATQTYATVTLQNYFRMYHKLAGMTGTAETEAGEFWEIYKLDVVVIPTNKPIIRDDRQDYVFKTTKEKYNAVAEEIQALVDQGRPVLVGTTSVENSEIISRSLRLRKIEHQVLNAKQHAREAEVVANAGKPGAVTIATNMAGRGTDIKLAPESRNAGGLAILGTERHESRRVDRQLRGRSGRQGDPGSSQFYVSLQDDLMRRFGSDRVARIMDRMGHEEGDVIQHSMITKSIERAQKKVEENNFAIRKRLLEFDDVMNQQREVIYKKRHHALFGERLQLDIMNAFHDTCSNIVNMEHEQFSEFQLAVIQAFGIQPPIEENQFAELRKNPEQLSSSLYDKVIQSYRDKNKIIAEKVSEFVDHVKETKGVVVKEIVVPFSDGTKQIQVVTGLQEAFDTRCVSLIKSMEQSIVLALIDNMWKEHLREMDDLKTRVYSASFEQKDPLLIYKFEAFELFKSFLAELSYDLASFLSRSSLVVQAPDDIQEAKKRRPQKRDYQENKPQLPGERASDDAAQAQGDTRKPKEVTKPLTKQKVHGRNDLVTVRYKNGEVKKDVKYKKIEKDLEADNCVLVE